MTIEITEKKFEEEEDEHGYTTPTIYLGSGKTDGKDLAFVKNRDKDRFEIRDLNSDDVLATNTNLAALVRLANGKYVEDNRLEYV